MCGIVGMASKSKEFEFQWVNDALSKIKHRGPDSNGIYVTNDGHAVLGHVRLSIIDLSDLGKQPMTIQNGKISITFNGEIYNFLEIRNTLEQKGYKFISHSDTEVILLAYKEWGYSCVERLNGMFAFAIYDEYRRTLFLARDRAGEKPLFYYCRNGAIRFASELKAILADKSVQAKLNQDSLDVYLTLGYVLGERCILSGFNKLCPGQCLTFNVDSGVVNQWRYWNFPELCENSVIDETNLIAEMDSLLRDSISKQLISDVPVGVLLSGGLDSSLIAAIAASVSSRIKTFTISFPGHDYHDESKHARLISDYFDTEHTELPVEEFSINILEKLATQFDEPMNDSSMIPTYMVSNLVKRHCTVALGGDGGDELFGGYGGYANMLKLQAISRKVPRFFRDVAATAATSFLPLGFKGRNWLASFGGDWDQDLPFVTPFFDWKSRKKLMKSNLSLNTRAEAIRKENISISGDLIQRATRTDFENYLVNDILVKVDRASMLNSLEVRAPFLDYRIIEFAFKKLPSSEKVTTTEKKIFLKKVAKNILPPKFDYARKQGFSIPLNTWLQRKGLYRSFFEDVLLDQDSFFSQDFILNLFDGIDKGRANSERLFGLVIFELWRKKYSVSY
jgi:asparagine synthase (glutamine-hydrolysing)